MDWRPGQDISHYHLVEKIGEGGMGVVWKAVDSRLEREVALKFLSEKFREEPSRLARFEHEARVVASLNHPNIVTIYSVEEFENSSFITMELVSGQPLASVIPPKGMPLTTFFELAIPMADAIAAAHSRGITHRDLKPGNVMVGPGGRVKILDFGLAKSHESRPSSPDSEGPTISVTRRSEFAGTLPYMSPEQIRGGAVDHPSDIFSLGIIFHQMLTGARPFDGKTAADVIAAILKDPPPDVTRVRSGLPHHLGRIIRQCLQKDPDRRFQAGLELKNQLEDLSREIGAGDREIAPSIAVLPFIDLSPSRDQEYLCEGIAEEIINALTRIKGLRVASRTSSFRYRHAAVDSPEIGLRLRVRTLLEGSVRKADDRLRITAQLTDAASGYHMWSERYDRQMKDVFAIQDEIAGSIVQALQITLGPAERSAMRTAQTTDVRAYDYYLRGRKFYYQYRRKGIEFARQMFSRAIDLDRDYALAYAGIADCCAYLYMYAERNDRYLNEADEASRRALELSPDSAQVHASRGSALSLLGRHDDAEAEFQEATRLDPALFESFYFYARDCFAQGLLQKAARLYEQAAKVRPEDYQVPLLVAQIYSDLGHESLAEETRRRGVRIAEDHLKLHPDDTRAMYLAANGLVALGERKRGLELACRALEMEPDESMLLYNVGCIMALAAEIDRAVDCLEKAVERGLSQKAWFEMDSNLDPLREHPRFQSLLRKL